MLSIGGRFGGLLKLSHLVRACDEAIYYNQIQKFIDAKPSVMDTIEACTVVVLRHTSNIFTHENLTSLSSYWYIFTDLQRIFPHFLFLVERLVGTAFLEEAFRLSVVGTSAVVVALALDLFDLDSVALSRSGFSN